MRALFIVAALYAVLGCRGNEDVSVRIQPRTETVVASNGDDRVTLAELQAFLDGFAPERRAEVAPTEGRRAFLRNYILYRASLRRARAADYANDPRVRRARDRAMAMHWAEDRIAIDQPPPITDEELRSRWAQARGPDRPERVRARHILLADRTEAEAVRTEILRALARPGVDAEAVFATAAREKSRDRRTRDKGGDLLFFSRGGGEAAWRLAPATVLEAALSTGTTGQVSLPLEGPDGLHLVMLTARREAERRSFDEEAPDLRSKLALEHAETARKALESELLDMDDWTVDDGALDGLRVAPAGEAR